MKKIVFYLFALMIFINFACKPSLKLVISESLDTTKAVSNEEKDPLESSDYIKEVYLDSIFTGAVFSDYIEKGRFKFYTCRNIQPWLDALYIQLGKPDSLNEGYQKEYYWHKKDWLNYEKITIFCSVNDEDKPPYFGIELTFLDKNLQLIEDTVFLNSVKKQIKDLVFKQEFVKNHLFYTFSVFTIGKHPYFSIWREFTPNNYHAIMKLMTKDKRITLDLNEVSVKCLIDTTGKITKWKLDLPYHIKAKKNEKQLQKEFAKHKNLLTDTTRKITKLTLEDPDEIKLEKELQKQFSKYKELFKYPVLYSLNDKQSKIWYKTQFNFKNIITDSIDTQARLKQLMGDLKNGKYKEESKRGKTSKENTSQAGNTTFFKIEQQGYESVMANIPFGSKLYSFFLDQGANKLYTFEKDKQNWHLRQTIELEDVKITLYIDDLDKDGYGDLIASSPPNMNGNRWSNVYVYHAEKDSFLLGVENFCCIDDFYADSTYQPNQKYYITHYRGSWYMPQTTSIFSWQNKKLQLEVIFGVELLQRDMSKLDYRIFFVKKNINGKMQTIEQINIDAGDQFIQKANQITQQILKEYFN